MHVSRTALSLVCNAYIIEVCRFPYGGEKCEEMVMPHWEYILQVILHHMFACCVVSVYEIELKHMITFYLVGVYDGAEQSGHAARHYVEFPQGGACAGDLADLCDAVEHAVPPL